MQRNGFRYLWVITVLVAAGLACNLTSDVGRRVGGLQETAQSVATELEGGRDLLATGQAVATQVLGNEAVQTAKAAIEENGPSILATAGAVVTEQGPGVLATLEAVTTEQGPSIAATAQAIATNNGSELVETAQAIATRIASSSGAAPEDIPLVEGEKDELYTSSEVVSYLTPLDFKTVMDFYEKEMPANNWEKDNASSLVTGNTALLNYTKPGRQATIVITLNTVRNQTAVVINIQSK